MALATSTLKIDALGAAGALVITAVAAAAGLAPSVLAHRSSRTQQEADLKRLQQEAAALDKEIDAARASAAKLEAQAGSAIQLRPAERLNDELTKLTTLAEEHDLTMPQMTPGTPTSEPRAVLVPIKLAGSGTFGAISAFIHELHGKFRDTAVTGFRLAAPPSDNSPRPEFTLELTWYAAPEGSAVSAAPIGAPPK